MDQKTARWTVSLSTSRMTPQRSSGLLYKEYCQRLIFYCIRALGEEEEYGIQFLPDQEEILNELWEIVDANEEDEEAIDLKVLKVSALLIMHSDYAVVDVGTCIAVRGKERTDLFGG